MKSKVKKRCKQMLTGLLALSMLCGLLLQNTVNVSAATTAKTTVSSYGRLGTVDVGSKTKSGTWWKINVGSKTAFCLSLGKTCHTGNTYQVTDGIDVIKELVLGCVGGVGVIFLAWGLLDFGTGYSAHDTTQQSQAIKKVIGGLIMVAVPAILKLLGVS